MALVTPLTSANLVGAIKGICEAAVSTAVVIPYQLLGLDEEGGTADYFRNSSGVIKSVMFWREAVAPNGDLAGSPLKTGKAPSFDPARLASAGQLSVETWVYRFKIHLGYDTGANAANSQGDFDLMIDTLTHAFKVKPKLGLQSYQIDRHGGLFFPSLSVVPFNDTLVHVGQGQLAAVLHRPATPS